MWRTGASLAAIAAVSLIAGSACAQGMDGGPPPSQSVEFEGVPPGTARQSATAPGTMTEKRRKDLRAELEGIAAQLREIDMLLDGVNRGEFLVGLPGMMVTMSRQDIARYVAEGRVMLTDPNDPLHILGLDGSPESKVEHLVRQASERSRVLAAGLRDKRQELWVRRDQIMRELDADRRAAMAGVRPGDAYNPNADYSSPRPWNRQSDSPGGYPACALPHRWRFDVAGMGSSVWQVEPSGQASESGLGGARGTASFSGSSINVKWQTGAYQGYFEITLDASCSGRGTLYWTQSPTGPASFPVTFTSLGGGKQ